MSRTSAGASAAVALGGLAAGLAAAASAYWFLARPWHLRWGATALEVARALPGDELVPHAKISSTHAITIQATPAEVWPWLVQLGQGRGGFYSYDWIEDAMGLEIHSADRILPKYQELKVGDTIPLAPDAFGLRVAILETEHTMVLYGDTRLPGTDAMPPLKPGEFLAASWGFYLFRQADDTTRLVERWRADYTSTVMNTAFYRAFLEPGAFLMQRKMLLGIKARAEGISRGNNDRSLASTTSPTQARSKGADSQRS
jgi:hypothetical protein